MTDAFAPIVYITKYATTRGLVIEEGLKIINDVKFGGKDLDSFTLHTDVFVQYEGFYLKIGKTAFFKQEDAIKDMEKRLRRKIANLEKTIEKLRHRLEIAHGS